MQNEHSLLCRLYDTDMAEMSMLEDVGLIAFSPLAGLLTGKYQNERFLKARENRLSLTWEGGLRNVFGLQLRPILQLHANTSSIQRI